MNIAKVSMIGANERLAATDIIDFIRAYPLAEIGIGVSATKGARGTPRFDYVQELQHLVCEKCVPGKTGTIALHINGNGKDGDAGWPAMLSRGIMPYDLAAMMKFPNMSIQLNHFGYNFPAHNAQRLADSKALWNIIAPQSRLILSYCEKTADYIDTFMRAASTHHGLLKWDVLYDASFGNGKMTAQYAAPLYPGIRQGYAGGLGPDNILDELPKIKAEQTDQDAEIWIDAEGKLQNDAKTTLDLTRAEAFYKKIMDFQRQH